MPVKRARLSFHEAKFIEGKAKGFNNKDSAIFAGYAPLSAGVQASRLLKKEKIIQALEDAGLSDKVLMDTLKTNMESGTGIKATADTSLKAIEIALKLKGHLQGEEKTPDLTQNNIYIQELHNLSEEDLSKRLEELKSIIVSPSVR